MFTINIQLRFVIISLSPETFPVIKTGTRFIAIIPHMPFAKMAGRIAGLLQVPRQGRCFGVQPLGHAPALICRAIVQVGIHAPALWILPGAQSRARGRTDGRVHIELRESNTLSGKPVDSFCFHFLVAEAGKVAPAHVINEHHNDIRLGGSDGERHVHPQKRHRHSAPRHEKLANSHMI
ncbi:hypothetical protein SDC9_162026 [bioreactor metagenome]|uniref:Uncharacterized protein n=1 Tax=bioreactor metagenome TaxID=1076179 RepID=A0A645FMY3_9ZZZZ